MRTYLRVLIGENNKTLLDDITKFTVSFGSVHTTFTVGKLIKKIDDTLLDGDKYRTNPAFKPDYAIGIPPDVVIDYLDRNGKKATKVELDCPSTLSNNVILGLGTLKKGAHHRGLKHWVYKKNSSEVYNWGKKYSEKLLMKDGTCAQLKLVYEIQFI